MTERAKIITVFGSSRPEDGHADYAEALELGRALASAGFAVCTGGYGGVMEAVSRGARESGGRVLAVTSGFFRSRANRWVEEETRVDTWQERLFELVRLGDGYVACKGGTGTLVELAVVWEMLNKKAMDRAPVRGARRFLAADSGSRARSRTRARFEVGRVHRSAGPPGAHSRGSRSIFGCAIVAKLAAWKGCLEKRVAHRGRHSRI